MLADTTYEHIQLDDQGVAVIAGTGMKVHELVAERLAWGWSPEELLLNHTELTLGQVFSALAYYADHEAEMHEAIERDIREMEELRARSAGPGNAIRRSGVRASKPHLSRRVYPRPPGHG